LPDIASAALRYQGASYVFGGIPSHGIGQWDCSSFVNWVVGHDLKMAIPGYSPGTYNGQTHGPVVLDWATWSGASTHKGPPARGDLCVWPGAGAGGHVGIAVSGTQMISALNHSEGTKTTGITGFGPRGVAVVFRSLSGNSSGGVSVPSLGIPGCLIGLVLMPYEIVKVSGGHKVKNMMTGRFYSRKPQSEERAKAQLRALEAAEHNPGWRGRRARRAAR